MENKIRNGKRTRADEAKGRCTTRSPQLGQRHGEKDVVIETSRARGQRKTSASAIRRVSHSCQTDLTEDRERCWLGEGDVHNLRYSPFDCVSVSPQRRTVAPRQPMTSWT